MHASQKNQGNSCIRQTFVFKWDSAFQRTMNETLPRITHLVESDTKTKLCQKTIHSVDKCLKFHHIFVKNLGKAQ